MQIPQSYAKVEVIQAAIIPGLSSIYQKPLPSLLEPLSPTVPAATCIMGEASRPQKPFTLSIIGGGLAGILLAIGLTTRGVPVRIYEAQPAFTETSAGIGFGPNAVRAMSMLNPRIRTAFDNLKTENGWDSKRNTWFDFRTGWGHTPKLVAESKMGDGKEGGGNVLRARFMEELVKLLPEGCALFGKTLSWMEEHDGRVSLRFDDGTTAIADAVVGCDGIRSVVRKMLFGQDHEASQAVFSGVYGYRGLIDMDTAIATVGEKLALNAQTYMGKDGDLVTYPIEEGTVLNVVAFQKHKGDSWEHPRWVVDSSREELMKDFEDWGDLPKKILKLVKKPQVWAIFDMPHAPYYSLGHIALLGDAAHASTSHAGAGAGMAVEDAVVLSEILSEPRIKSVDDVPGVFSAYNAVRRPRTQRLVKHSRESGMLYQLRKPGVDDDLEKVKADLEVRQRWIWDFDLSVHLEEVHKRLWGSLIDSSS